MLKLKERKASIHPIKSKLRISILSDEEIKGINQTALNILEDVGFNMPSVKALRIFADAGAIVDFDKQLVKLPGQLVIDSLKTAPRQYTLCGRRSDLDAKIGSGEGTYFYCSGEAPRIVDMNTGEKRLSIKRDIEQMAQIADFLSIVSLVWPTVSASDKGEAAPLHGLEACFANTEKHVQTESVMTETTAKYAVEMASIIAGGRDRLRERPLHSFLLCAIQPLAHDRGGVEAALTFAEAGLPVGIMSMPTLGLTGPPYSAGSLAMAMAEVLSGCVLIQIAYPGTPVFISIIPSIINPRSGSYFMGSSAAQITSAACVELAHSNGLPITSCMSFGGSQYRLNNWQTGIENFYVHLLTVMAGADMSFGPSGMIEAVRLLDMRRIMYDREIFQVIDSITNGFEVNDNTLAFDMIKEVGPRGMFITQRRTATELPKLWPQSILFEEPENRAKEKFKDSFKVAHESIEWILKNHQPEPLPEDIRRELIKIVATADQDEKLKREVRGDR